MKKIALGFLIPGTAACLIYVVTQFFCQPSPQSPDTEVQNVTESLNEQKAVFIQSNEIGVIKIPAADQTTYPTATPTDENQIAEETVVYTSEEVTPQPENAVIHSAADFAYGEGENLVIDGGFRLANSNLFNEGEKIIGTFYSMPVEAQQPFDSVTVTYQGITPDDDSTLKMEIRVRFENIGWSDWLIIDMNNISLPIALEAMADSWQYRVTMSADEILKSPQLDQVAVIAQTTTQP